MATTYKATIQIKCWKQHECVGCGGVYRYKFARTVSGEAGNESAAEKAAEKAAMTTMEKDVDQRPCPRCGCLQPDMIAQKKSNTHFWVALLLLLVSGLFVVLGLIPNITWLTYSSAGLILGVASLAGLARHAATALANPNKNKDANRNRAEAMIERGELEKVADEDEELADGEPKAVGGAVIPLLAAGVIGALLALTPFLLKTVSGWPTVAGTKPEVVGPGDTVTVWFPDKIQAVKGYWSGTPTATVVNDGGAGPFSVSATAKTASWGNTISGKSVSNSTPSLWADVKLPNDSKLVGKTIEVKVDMAVHYPTASGRGFDNADTRVSTTQKLTLAGGGAGGTYYLSMWLAALGAVVVAISGFGLMASANGLRKFAAPADIITIERKGRKRDRDEDTEDEDDRPRRRRDEDDGDDRPRGKRRRDDDEDEDDRPRRRHKDDDYEDEDDRDRRRRRRYDD